MSNLIKYSTTAQTQALKTGDFWIATGDVLKGSTSTSGFWNGISPPTSGYTIYLNKASQGPSIYVPTSDSQLIDYTNKIGTQSFTSVTQCFNWYNTQSDKMVFNKDYPAIITSGLVLNLDATFLPSYSTSGTTWYDLSPNGNNGTLVNGPVYNSGSGGYINFDGADDYVNCGSSLLISRPFTINCWVYFNSLTNWQTIVGQDTSQLTDFAAIYFQKVTNVNPSGGRTANTFGLAIFNTSNSEVYCYDTATIQTGIWYNYCVSVSTSQLLLYRNGVLVRTTNNSSTMATASGNLLVGAGYYGGNIVDITNGRLTNVTIYNRALSSAEILQNFYGSNIVTSGLTLYLDAGNIVSYPQTGTVWYDISSGGNNGTLINGPTFDSANGGSIVFDGTNDYGTISNQGVITDNITIETAVYVPNLLSWPYNGGIFGLVSNSGYFRECWVNVSQPQGVLQNTYSVNFLNLAGSTGNGIQFGTFTSTSIVYLTYTQTGTSAKTYANGNLVNSQTITKYTRPASNNLSVAFGWVDNDANYGHYRGNIYFIRVYNRELTAAEVLQNYNATRTRFCL